MVPHCQKPRLVVAILTALLAHSPNCSQAAKARPARVVFSELMWTGSSASSADEWVELVNLGADSADLSGWTITRLGREGEQVMLQLESGTTAPGETFLIANYGPGDSRSMLATDADLVTKAVSLPNTKLQLRLYAGSPESGAVMDVADDGRGAPLAGDVKAKAAMVRVLFGTDGTSKAAWQTANTASGWDDGAGELGTPGSIPEHLRHQVVGRKRTAVIYARWSAVKSGARSVSRHSPRPASSSWRLTATERNGRVQGTRLHWATFGP